LTRRLNDLKTNFEEEGIQVSYERDGKHRIIRICKIPSEPSYRHAQERLDGDDTNADIDSAVEIPSYKKQEPDDGNDDNDDKLHNSQFPQKDRLINILKVIKRLCKNSENNTATTDKIRASLGSSFHSTLEQDLEELREAGFIYEPKPGHWRHVS
jgi:DNA replicative helicase MCM subunit Mcm2 (Cdc46/Mcm family)